MLFIFSFIFVFIFFLSKQTVLQRCVCVFLGMSLSSCSDFLSVNSCVVLYGVFSQHINKTEIVLGIA